MNDWCFSIKYNDDDELFKWEVEMECPGDTFPYCISLLHSTRFKKTKNENLHKRLHASFYSGIDVMYFNRVHRKLQWNPFTNQIMGVQHNELLENDDTKWQNFGKSKIFFFDSSKDAFIGESMQKNVGLEHSLIISFYRDTNPKKVSEAKYQRCRP